jgi:hypothetical protein
MNKDWSLSSNHVVNKGGVLQVTGHLLHVVLELLNKKELTGNLFDHQG